MEQPVPVDTIYQTFSRGLYKLTGTEQTESIMDMLNPSAGADNSTSVTVPSDLIGSGPSTSTTQTASGSVQQGKKLFDNSVPGYILGVDPKDGFAKFYIGNASNYINWDGTTLTVVGGANVSSLNIPDTTTANSFHVDTSGNAWWGANVASGYTSANAYVLNTGAAVFKNIQVGGTITQYTMNNNGYFSYGDGSDGALVINADVSLSQDRYYTDLTINAGKTLTTNGYRLFVNGTLTVNGTIDYSGNAGGDGADANGGTVAGGTAGAALPDGYLKGSVAGKAGHTGSNGSAAVGTAGDNVANSLGSSGASGGQSGGNSGGGGPAAGGGGGGSATAANVKLIANWHLFTLLDVSSSGSTVKFNTSAGTGSGAGGGQLGGGSGGGGGGSASPGGTIAIYARIITIGAAGKIKANGANGGKGGSGTGGGGQGGGGGAASNGGTIILAYNQLTNNGSITVTHGTGGAGGGGSGNVQASTAGGDGVDGVIYQFQLSL